MSDDPTIWSRLVIAVVGGDEREREIARRAATTGAEVRAFGIPWPDAGIAGVQRSESAAAALEGARVALFPIPGIDDEGHLFAPQSPVAILPDRELLAAMAPAAHIILGYPDERLTAAAAALGIGLHEYESDRELMLLRGPAICEGALELAIRHTDVTIHASPVGVVGQGTIGSLMTQTLIALGARVHVFARNPVQRATAYTAGAQPHRLDELATLAPELAMIFSSVPAPVVDTDTLERLPAGSLVMDLAAPPGGVNLALAERCGHVAVWARGMGRRAPVTVGASQWQGIRKRIVAALEG